MTYIEFETPGDFYENGCFFFGQMIFSNKWDLLDLIGIAPIYAFFMGQNSNSIIVVLLGRREYNITISTKKST
jgi:hypothetical protein